MFVSSFHCIFNLHNGSQWEPKEFVYQQNIFSYVPQKKESHTGLKRHEGE